MNEEDQGDDTTECENEAEGNRQVRNKCAFVAAAHHAQHDQAICENAGEDPKHDLRDTAASVSSVGTSPQQAMTTSGATP
jgi:hypothetical protein